MRISNQVFISYAHEDVKWKDRFRDMFAPAVGRGSVTLWSDDHIPVGQNWSKQIDAALASAGVGLLLVTPDFLKSPFITDVELKRLLSLATTANVAIHWVPISAALFKQTPLSTIQAACDPDCPLDQLPVTEQGSAVQRICHQIVEDYGFLPKVTGGHRKNLPDVLQARLGDKYDIGEEVGSGSFSIVYRAQQKNPSRTVGVKLLVASEFDHWVREAFAQAVQRAAELTSATFIKIIEHSLGEMPEFLVTEFVNGQPLGRYLNQYPKGVPLANARNILVDLARGLEEIHQKGWARGEICSSNVLMQSRGVARLSGVDCTAVLGEESRMSSNFLVDRESLVYMTPERFFGLPHTQITDQYSLGLIAVELLGGQRIPRVNSPSDLEGKRRLFEDLESGRGAWAQRSEEFGGLVKRLLAVGPDDRWPSMRDVRYMLRDLDVAESEEEASRKAARSSYLRMQLRGQQAFFAAFYRNLFAACPDVERHFTTIDMAQQYKIVNKAIKLLLDFDPLQGSEELRDLAAQHAAFGLNRQHYDLFLEALVKTMAETGDNDPNEIAAWRNALTPAVDFMCTCQGLAAPGADSPTSGH